MSSCSACHARWRTGRGTASRIANTAAGQADGGLSRAATAFSKATLIASDCGLPDLARSLCRRHAEVYLCAQPLSTQVARFALEPLINLGRLLVRSGDGDAAYLLLDTLFQAVKTGALSQLRGHKGVGVRMLDGRQVAAIAGVTTGEPTTPSHCNPPRTASRSN